MNNLRIIYDNAADRAQLRASSAVGNLAVRHLQTNDKGRVWRAAANSATITATWSQPEIVGGLALPFTNLTSTATIRARGYEQEGEAEPVFDTGVVLACPYVPLHPATLNERLGVNAYTRGGARYGRVWFERAAVRHVVIDVIDIDNPRGYIEAARLVIGNYWSPEYSQDHGASATPNDTSELSRTAGGSQFVRAGVRFNSVSLQLSYLEELDRALLWRLLQGNGKIVPVFLSLYPESASPEREQAHQVFGRFPEMPSLAAVDFNIFSAPLQVEEI